MTEFYKTVDENGYISGFGTNGSDSATAITESEYNAIMAFWQTKPAAPDGYAYVMRDTPREWVQIEVHTEPDEPDAEEALSILLGGVEA